MQQSSQTNQMLQASVALMTESYAHKIQGNRTQAIMYLSPHLLTLDHVKSEALDAFGLFDISHGDGNSTDCIFAEERKSDLRELFTLSVRV